ncbi:MAG: TM0106 family RecB-like putative nuclease [Dermatophilaceae bacterium]
MFLLGANRRVVVSASDLRTASVCEFALIAGLDVLRGLRPRPTEADDPMLARITELGDQHEQTELRRLSRTHPGRVVQLARPEYTPTGLARAMAGTIDALGSGAEVVYQATLFDGGFVGHADFLERTADGWLVSDTKLARRESVPALLQVAAYAALLASATIDTAPIARLVLGGGQVRDIPLHDVLPVYRSRRSRLDAILAEHLADDAPLTWGDPRWLACGRCEACAPEVEAARDLLLVAGVRGPTRRRLVEAGVRTIDELATRTNPVLDLREITLTRLREQARLQLEQEADPTGGVRHEVVDESALLMMPEPSPGDVFFDFEADPLWQEPGSPVWGLEYLFGLVELDTGEPVFRAFWAHDRAAERRALVAFIEYLAQRRRRWPDLHVYHYAPYEPAALLRLAARHGVCEDAVDQLLREGVLVDLYAVVRSGIRISQRSYSIKKLEPLYMAERTGAVTAGDQSIVVYHQFLAATVAERTDEAAALLGEIADYNRDDCVSTWLLRDWLVRLAPGPRVPRPPVDEAAPVVSDTRLAALDLEAALRALVANIPVAHRTPEHHAVAMVAAAVLFHAREDKPRWQEHYERLRVPVRDWRAADGVFVVERAEVERGWLAETPRQRPRRLVRLHGEPMRGIPLTTTSRVGAVYAAPTPPGVAAEPGHANAQSPASLTVRDAVEHLAANGRLSQSLLVEELQPKDGEQHAALPVALVPNGVVGTGPIDAAIAEVAAEVRRAGALPDSAAVDVLLQRPPRLADGAELPAVGTGEHRHADAIIAALRAMGNSYVAVQGPPGTGKTHVGAQVLTRLVAQGWRVGVTSQSHAAVEHLLTRVVAAGTAAHLVAKEPRATPDPMWTPLATANELAAFAADRAAAGTGYVIGGSAWDLTNVSRVDRGQLDLLVIDEAGQFSLAKTLAVSVSAQRLLLLGDPQQLPQVSTGIHAEPVDASALGWLLGAEAVLPATRGYFLETTWRLHPALTAPVSRLAYAGQLRSAEPVTAARQLEGVEPGLHVRLVDHRDNSTRSGEEAEVVHRLVRDLIGRGWHDPSARRDDGAPVGPRPLAAADLLVITPYNSQVGTIRRVLDDAGLGEVRVGTVDRFQGQEAPVAILSMAASSPSSVSRGLAFLLDRHRLNVAVSRGQHSVFLVRSRLLADFSPQSPEDLVALGSFLALGDAAVTTEFVAATPSPSPPPTTPHHAPLTASLPDP